jgi:dihydropteroate synthase
LVGSVTAKNRDAAHEWGWEGVVVPELHREEGMPRFHETVEYLSKKRVPHRLDQVLNPLCFGFAQSLGSYLDVRSRYCDAEIMMGIGNVTELVDADSAAINVLLLGVCQELGIRSVLTTQVIHWAQSSVRECDLARRLVHYAVTNSILAKHLEPKLIPLRGLAPVEQGHEALERLAAEIKDSNYRIFAEEEELHLVSGGMHLRGNDPFFVFEQLLLRQPKNLDAGHAFYLGFEMAKAAIALALDKEYRQDEALDWGFLTRPEDSHRLKRTTVRNRMDDREGGD